VKPYDVGIPVDPLYTEQQWQEVYAAQKPSSEYSPNTKQEYAGKGNVPLDEENERIVGGVQVPNRCMYPWMVAIITDNMYFCGGTIISQRWVLTAAHCIGRSHQLLFATDPWNVVGSGSLLLQSSTVFVHPNYASPNNDIALIYLPSNLQYTNCIQPVRLRCIPGNLAGQRTTAIGWGATFTGGGVVPNLRHVNLTVITNAQCRAVFGNIITDCIICTDGNGPRSTCHGDSGGPLVYLENDGVYTQVGIASFVASIGCDVGLPAGFTRLNCCFLSWIASHTGLVLPCSC